MTVTLLTPLDRRSVMSILGGLLNVAEVYHLVVMKVVTYKSVGH